MGIWTDIAEWRGPTPNHSGHMLEQRGVVLHIAEGGYEGTISWCKNPNSGVSCHFVVAKDGRIAQLADTDVTVWTQIAGNGHWLSVENEGFTPNALTAEQVEANARILAKAHQVYGVPLQIATNPDGRGLGHHSMGTNGHDNPTDTWTGPTWGHEDCPGPAIVNQKPEIIDIAAGGDDVALSDADAQALIYRVEAIINNRPTVAGGPTAGEVNALHDKLAELEVAIAAIQGGTVDQAAVEAAAAAGAKAGIEGATIHTAP